MSLISPSIEAKVEGKRRCCVNHDHMTSKRLRFSKSSFVFIPLELLRGIISYVSLSDFRNVATVNKRWGAAIRWNISQITTLKASQLYISNEIHNHALREAMKYLPCLQSIDLR